MQQLTIFFWKDEKTDLYLKIRYARISKTRVYWRRAYILAWKRAYSGWSKKETLDTSFSINLGSTSRDFFGSAIISVVMNSSHLNLIFQCLAQFTCDCWFPLPVGKWNFYSIWILKNEQRFKNDELVLFSAFSKEKYVKK